MIGIVRKYGLFSRCTAILVLTAALSGTSYSANAPRDPFNGRQSYSSSSMDCLVANDFYAVHFTSMQEGRRNGETSDFTNYCQEIPVVGKTYLSIDLLDRDVRTTPVALRVIEESYSDDGQTPREKSTVLEVPPKIYRTGTADTAVEITRPGHYALIATIGEDAVSEDDRLRIPFSVAVAPPTNISSWYKDFAWGLAAVFFAVMSVIGYRTYRSYNPRTAGGSGADIPAWQAQRQEKRT